MGHYTRRKEQTTCVSWNPQDVTKLSEIKGDKICPYSGELLDKRQLDARYGDHTAPYGIEIAEDHYDDVSAQSSITNTEYNRIVSLLFQVIESNRIELRATIEEHSQRAGVVIM